MKNLKSQFIVIPVITIFFLGMLFGLLVLTFPGAKIFYKSVTINTTSVEKVDKSFRTILPINATLYNLESILVTENGSVLNRSFTDDKRYIQNGTFYIGDSNRGLVDIFFTPGINTAGSELEQDYQILIRLNILSSNNPGRFTVAFIAGLVIFFGFKLFKNSHTPINRQVKMENFFSRFMKMIQPPEEGDQSLPWNSMIMRSGVDLLLLSYLFVFLEWLFTITMPSFMDHYSFFEKLRIFLTASVIASVAVLTILFLLLMAAFLFSRFKPGIQSILAGIPFAFLATSLVCLLLDNFLTTVFSVGIAGSSAMVRILLSFVIMCIFLYTLFYVSRRYTVANHTRAFNAYRWFAFGLLVVSVPSVVSLLTVKINNKDRIPNPSALHTRPNIILISSDGLDASHMSVYGYERDTTPFLRELAATSLVSENNFPNTDHSLGSETSILTGRNPAITGVLFSPDILRGNDRFLHLPGILKNAGYRTVTLGVPYYIDANVVNFQHAFDDVNCAEKGSDLSQDNWFGNIFDEENYFLQQIHKRVKDRLFHIFYIRDFKSPIANVNEVSGYTISDQARLRCLWNYLAESKETGQPIFVHMHQMGTHGPTFETTIQRFSSDQEQDQVWMTDFYDDAIINFDSDISTLVDDLKTLGIYQNTIIGIYTDHGTEWTNAKRLPLILHFPNGQGAGRVRENTQNLDIPPTILDYLGMEIPPWMDGLSLLSTIPQGRIIFSVESIEPIKVTGLWTMPIIRTNLPFRQMESIKAFQCQKITTLDLGTLEVIESSIEDHTSPCPPNVLSDRLETISLIGQFLHRAGFQLPKNWEDLR